MARELRKAGERERAGEVAALRKPSVAAWAVNQLVRTQRQPVADLLEAGDALRAAQDDVLAGRGDAQSLRAAVEHERAAVDALTDAARGLLSSEGNELSETIIERVSDTLHAAALDDEARSQVSEGRLERELRHVGLGGFGALGAAPPAPRDRASGLRSGPPPRRPARTRRRRPANGNARPARRRRPGRRPAARPAPPSARPSVARNGPSVPRTWRASAVTRRPRRYARPRRISRRPRRTYGTPAAAVQRGRGRVARRRAVGQCSSAITSTTITTTTRAAPPNAIGRWRHQNSGSARSRVYRPSGGVPTQSSSSSYPLIAASLVVGYAARSGC